MGRGFDDEFAEFVQQWSPPLLRVAFLLTSDRGEAEDLLQTALLKTSRHWSRLSDREAAYAYVRRVIVTTNTTFTQLYHWTGDAWAAVERKEPCATHEVPADIYVKACESN